MQNADVPYSIELCCVCVVKMPVRLSDELNRFPTTSTASRPAADVTIDAHKVSLLPMTSPALKQNASSLSVLLDALDQNLAEQGVIVQPKGVCAPCSKPIVGRVSNVKVSNICPI